MGRHESESWESERHSPATLLAALELVDAGVFVFDDDGTIRETNEVFASLVGANQGDLLGTTVSAILVPVNPGVESDSDADFTRLLTTATDEVAVHPTSGETTTQLTLAGNKVDDRWVCVCRAKTAESQYGESPTSSERQPSSAVDHQAGHHEQRTLDAIGDPVYVLGRNGTIEQVNDELLAITGYDRDELVGRDLSEVVPPSEYERLTDRLRTLAEDTDDETDTFEMDLVTSDGEILLTEVTVTIRRDEGGSYAGSVGIVRDIRERKRRERDLELLKQVLLRIFRHNVRNELVVTKSHAELLEDEIESALQIHTDNILESADRLLSHSEKAQYIEGVIETDERTDVDLVHIVERVLDTTTRAYPDATIDVDLPAMAPVAAHPRIRRAIEELLDNALEHAPPETNPQVDIWIDEGSNATTLFIEDESGGLADDEVQVLRSGSESDLEHMSGVGLWLIRWLVEYSGAEMIVHRTEAGTVMGIQFNQAGIDSAEQSYSPVDSPFTSAPDTIQEATTEQFRGDTVVGRSHARQQLEDIFEEVGHTGGHSVVLTGEAGIGKTTLIEQFREERCQDDDGPLVATGCCEPEIQSPYRPFQTVIDALPIGRSFDEIRATADVSGASDPEEGRHQQRALFSAIADQFREVVSEQPVVIIVEDMHWADDGTIDLFEFLVDELGRWSHPILFLSSYRRSDVDESHPVLDIADDADEMGRGTLLELEPFDLDEVGSLLQATFEIEAVPESFLEAFHDHTGGNPLFVRELAAHLVETLGHFQRGDELPADLDAIDAPDTIEQAIDQRLETLPDAVVPVLETGSILGESFSFDVLRAASDQSVVSLIESVNTLVRRAVWERSAGQLGFVHGVVRDQARNAIDETTEQRLHERAANAIESVHAGDLDEYAGRLGRHYEQIGRYETAFDYYRRAGDVAGERYANVAAIDAYQQALRLAVEHDFATGAAVGEVAADLASVYNVVGKPDKARDAVDTGLEVTPNESEIRCRLFREQQTFLETQGEYDQALEAAERQRELAEDLDLSSLEAGAIDAIGRIHRERGNYDEAEQYHQRSLEMYEDGDDQAGQARSLHHLGGVARRRGNFDRAKQYTQRSLELYEEIGDRIGQVRSLNELGTVAWYGGDLDQAQEYYHRTIEIAEAIGFRAIQAGALGNLGVVSARRGNYDQAEQYFRRSLNIREDIGDPTAQAKLLNNLGLVSRHRGNYEQAREFLKRSLDIKQTIGDRPGEAESLKNLGEVAKDRGNYDTAKQNLQRSLHIYEDIGDRPGAAESLNNLGAVAMDRGNFEQAEQYFSRSLNIFEDIGDSGGIAKSVKNLGSITWYRGNYDQAQEYYQESLEIFEDIGDRSGQAKSLNNLGAIAITRGNYEQAEQYHQRSLNIREEIGDRNGQATSINNLGLLAKRRGSYFDAEECYRRSLEIREDIGDQAGQAEVLQNLGVVALRRGNDEQAEQYLQRSLSIRETLGDPNGEAKSLLNLGAVARRRGNYEQAEKYCQHSLDIFEDLGDRSGQAFSLVYLGYAAYCCGNFEQAKQYFQRSHDMFDDIGEQAGRATSLCLLAKVARRMQDRKAASEYLDQVSQILADLNNFEIEADYHREQAILARMGSEYEQSMTHMNTIQRVLEDTDAPLQTIKSLLEATRLALAQQDTQEARETLDSALTRLEDLESPLEMGRALTLRGQVANQTGEPEAARDYCRDALTIFEEINALPDVFETLELLVELAREIGDIDQAREWCRQAQELREEAPNALSAMHSDWIGRHANALDVVDTRER